MKAKCISKDIKVKVDTTEIKQAIEEANQLAEILKEAEQIVDSLSGKKSKS